MLINDCREHPAHVAFISYTGKWPCLCHGILALEIDGQPVTFGNQDEYGPKLPDGSIPDHPEFWSTGGRCSAYPDPVEHGEWQVDVSLLPGQYRAYAEEIDAVLNRNIEHGCCGGCR